MADNTSKKKSRFLSRLLRDEAGNAIAIMAAAIVPVIGLVGGGVDVSRMYLVKAKLQSACDAGTLMGRRVMGSGSWTDDNSKADSEAKRLFDANFGSGAYGSKNLQRSYSESAGNVSGTASAVVPMAMMQVFGAGDRTMTVTCEAELRIPSTDVMFVLDTTGSMNCPVGDTGCGNNGNVEDSNAKMKGLRTAVRCFYEALAKENISDSSASDCGESADPSGGVSADVRLRFGFAPYNVNVNVGKLLPLDYLADSWSYQSREAVFDLGAGGTGFEATYGSESSPTQTGSTTSSGSNTDWVDREIGRNLAPASGGYWSWAFYANNANDCNITLPPNIPGSSNGNLNLVSQNPDPVTYPDNLITRIYESVSGTWEYEYRYKFYGNSPWGKICRMQRRETNHNSTTTTFETTQPVTWNNAATFQRWDYKKTTFDVSGLKDTNNNAWRQSLTLPLGDDGTGKTINWSGCIEERKTERINDSDPSDNWDPIPVGAHDMNIDLVPNTADSDTQWGPLLDNAYYRREERDSSGNWQYTNDTLSTSSNSEEFAGGNERGRLRTPYCPTQAALTQQWSAQDFSDYLTGLEAIGNTYHDIGMLWGARLLSPTGIFSANNNDQAGVVRHMVFMTDGNTQANTRDISAHGMHWWDRRQNDGSSEPTSGWLIDNIDARLQAVCKWTRNNNITLWVVYYGAASSTTESNMRQCVDNNNDRFFEAGDNTQLVRDFKTIADSISALRLTE